MEIKKVKSIPAFRPFKVKKQPTSKLGVYTVLTQYFCIIADKYINK